MSRERHFGSLGRAMELGQDRHPNALAEHHVAFANSVATLITGYGDGYCGPSMRERRACQIAEEKGEIGKFSFNDAVETVEEACYGPITLEHAKLFGKHCINDAPGEVEEAHVLLREEKSKE